MAHHTQTTAAQIDRRLLIGVISVDGIGPEDETRAILRRSTRVRDLDPSQGRWIRAWDARNFQAKNIPCLQSGAFARQATRSVG